MNNGKNGSSAGGGGSGAQVQRETISYGRIYTLLRAHLDTLAESDRRADAIEGLDRPQALRGFSDAVDGAIPILLQVASLARAEAFDLERGKEFRPIGHDEVTTETKRVHRRNDEESSPGRKQRS